MAEIGDVTQVMDEARRARTAAAFEGAKALLRHFSGELREAVQEAGRSAALAAAEKLERGEALDREALDLVRRWVVGDAEAALRQENNVQDWLDEFARLTDVIRRNEGRPLGDRERNELRGVIEDALGTATSLARHYDFKDRLERFDAALGNMDASGAAALARILRAKLDSPDR